MFLARTSWYNNAKTKLKINIHLINKLFWQMKDLPMMFVLLDGADYGLRNVLIILL